MQEDSFNNDLKKTQLVTIIRQSFLEMDAPFTPQEFLEYIQLKNPGQDIVIENIDSALGDYCKMVSVKLRMVKVMNQNSIGRHFKPSLQNSEQAPILPDELSTL